MISLNLTKFLQRCWEICQSRRYRENQDKYPDKYDDRGM